MQPLAGDEQDAMEALVDRILKKEPGFGAGLDNLQPVEIELGLGLESTTGELAEPPPLASLP